MKTPLAVAYAAVTSLPSLAPVVSAYLPVCLAFLAFVKWNGGIVLGESFELFSADARLKALSQATSRTMSRPSTSRSCITSSPLPAHSLRHSSSRLYKLATITFISR